MKNSVTMNLDERPIAAQNWFIVHVYPTRKIVAATLPKACLDQRSDVRWGIVKGV